MKKKWLQWTAICLVIACFLAGCTPVDLDALLGQEQQIVAFKDMEYTRPDVSTLDTKSQAVLDAVEAGESADAVMEKVFSFYEDYHFYYTNYALANIYYCRDLTDTYWEEEYNYCLETGTKVDATLDQMLYALAACDIKEELEAEDYFGEGFFDDFEGESIWDETFTALAEQEAQLESRYYELTEQSVTAEYYSEKFFTTIGAQMAELFVELVKVRQQMAEYAGYEDFPSFAYDFYYHRDYTPDHAEDYLDAIARELVPLYREADISKYWQIAGKYAAEADTYQYVKNCAGKMGGTIQEAFDLMETAGLYDISYSDKKYNASFEIYLSNYGEPYVFVNPDGTVADKLTFVHEFGHFCNDYASWGTQVGIDVAEFFSQGLEYLSLCYVGTEELAVMKMIDCLNLYVEQSCFASFEQQVYDLKGEELTIENVYALYKQVGTAYGFDSWGWDSRDFVLIPHFFTSPMYIISYVVSNDAALQLYQLEKENAGEGLAIYEENLDTLEGDFLAFVESAGLVSPFAQGRVETVRKTLEEVLQ